MVRNRRHATLSSGCYLLRTNVRDWSDEELWKSLAQLCAKAGLCDEPRRVLAQLSEIRSMDVVLPTRTGPEIRTRCVSKPTDDQQILLEKLNLKLPAKIIQKQMYWKLLTRSPGKHGVRNANWGSRGSVFRVSRFRGCAMPLPG